MAITPSLALLKTQSDDRLVALAQAGHESAFEAIVDRYRKPLMRHCRRVLSDGRAEDAVQQAFVQAWSALQRGDDVRELRPWLYRIARNCSLNSLRQSGFDHAELQESLRCTGDEPEEVAERRAVVRQTLAGLAALPERQREALLRMAVEGASQEELARDFGLSEGAVRQLVFRARASMRAACTAVTPLPFAAWLAAGGLTSAPAGIAVAAKVGAVVVVVGGAASAPLVIDHEGAEPATAALQNPAADRADPGPPAYSAPSLSLAYPPEDARVAEKAIEKRERTQRSQRSGASSRKSSVEAAGDSASATPGAAPPKGKAGGKASRPSKLARQRVASAKKRGRIKRRGDERFKKPKPVRSPPNANAENERAKSRPPKDPTPTPTPTP